MGFSALNLIWISLRFRETLTSENRQQARTRTRNPIAGLLSLGDSATRRANLVYFLYALVFSAFEATLSFLAAERLGYKERQLAEVFVFIGFISIFTQGGLVRRIIPKIGERAGAIGGFVLIAIGFAGLALAQSAPQLYGALAFVGVGSGFANTSLSSLVSLYSTSDEQGHALGIYRSLGSLSRSLGPLWAGIVFFSFRSEHTYFTTASLMVIPLLLGLTLPKPNK
jgi:MFS family permease